VHQTRKLLLRSLIAMAAACLAFTGSASADGEPAVGAPPRTTITSSALTFNDEPEIKQGWREPQFHTRKGRGFEYSRSLAAGSEEKIIFAIQGPLIKKRTAGLIFEFRF
jgi:hypothetical protein